MKEKKPIRPEMDEITERWIEDTIEAFIRFSKKHPGIIKHTTSEFILRQFNDFQENTIEDKEEDPNLVMDWSQVVSKLNTAGTPSAYIMDEIGHYDFGKQNELRSSAPDNGNELLSLTDFCRKYVDHNALVNLHYKVKGGHKAVETAAFILMAHQVDKTVYKDHKVLYVTSILSFGDYSEAVSIVLEEPTVETAEHIRYKGYDIRTSNAWYTLSHKEDGIIIMDPDGWDRTNYQYSFFEELVTYGEFMNRRGKSTCIFKKT